MKGDKGSPTIISYPYTENCSKDGIADTSEKELAIRLKSEIDGRII